MSTQRIFKDFVFDLPIKRKEPSVMLFLEKTFNDFMAKIKMFENSVKEQLDYDLIQLECDLLLESLSLYYTGKTSAAYIKLSECLELLKKNNLLEIGSVSNNFYRLRTSTTKSLTKGELFHIPFELRERVATQRYSIPGLPCLYMADSIFVAWEELDRPTFDNIHVSRINLSESKFKMLYLNGTSEEMRRTCFSKSTLMYPGRFVKFISYWPLLAACSLHVLKRNEVFKPEYIIPQMVLQYIISDPEVDGIVFKSNRINYTAHNVGTFNNIVIPVQTIEQEGHCKVLLQKVRLTPPLSWNLLDISDPEKTFLRKSTADIQADDLSRAYYIEVIEGEKTDYINSKFGILEEKLRTLPDNFI